MQRMDEKSNNIEEDKSVISHLWKFQPMVELAKKQQITASLKSRSCLILLVGPTF
jgi:hypothetical protein